MVFSLYNAAKEGIRHWVQSLVTDRRKGRRARTFRRHLVLEHLEWRSLCAVDPALLNSWFVAGQGENAQIYQAANGGTGSGPVTTWTNGSQTQSTAILGDVQKVQYSTSGNYVYVSTPDLASYIMGPWWNDATDQRPFVNLPTNQNSIYRIAYNSTYPSATHANTGGGPVGIAVNGVVFFNAGDAFSYSHATGADTMQPGGDGIFNRMAEWAESATFDQGNGHQPGNGQYHYHTDPSALRAQLNDNIDYVGSTDYFPYDPMVYYLTHGEGDDGTYIEHTTDLHHSPIIGWMFDGYPIYGPYGYSNPTDPTSLITRMVSSFELRTDLTTGSPRTSIPGWSAELDAAKLGATAAATTPDAFYTMTAAQQASYAGPAVSATYPLGRYGEDYAYVPGSGTLDQFNGRWCVTPEFPNGTYAYFATIDATGQPAFPYIINRQYYGGAPLNGSGKVTSITEAVTTKFDVTTNTAPVVNGPSAASVPQGGTLTFTGENLISAADVDAAAVESVTLTVDAGALSVDRTGVLAGLTTIAAGANNSSTLTLSGAVSELNAALATLTISAPSAGNAMTLTVQANDGSAAHNFSNELTTTIALESLGPVVTAPPTASVGLNGTLAFTGSGNSIAVADNAAASETVTISVTPGALSVTAGNATVTGNGSGVITVSGVLADVNAALGTLVYAAPSAGTSATLTVQANNGLLASNLAVVTLSLLTVNSPPSFTKGADETCTDESPREFIATWATNIAAGPPAESNQHVTFSVINDNPKLFAEQPAIDSSGDLSFAPQPNAVGTAQVTVVLKDDGGTDNGGDDSSAAQTFSIEVAKAHVWHNAANPLDVTGDSHVAPNDIAELILFLNGYGAAEVPTDGRGGGPYCDVDADGLVAPKDLLDLIVYLNAFGAGEGESTLTATSPEFTLPLTDIAATDALFAALTEDSLLAPQRSR